MERTKSGGLAWKIAAVVFAITFFVAAALILLHIWEEKQNQFAGTDPQNSVITFEGKDYVPRDGIESYLILGLDKFEGSTAVDSYNNDKQADFLMLFVLDNNAKTCTAVHINRDTMADVAILGVGGERIDTVKKQIALAHTYGNGKKVSCRNTKDSVEDLLLDVHIQHYVSFTMDSVAAMNDLVGGVEVVVLDDFSGIDETLVKGEKVMLNGEQALRYVRTRAGLEDSSNTTRMVRQQQYINALYEKLLSRMQIDEEFSIKLVDTMDEYVVYDSSNQKMQKFAEKLDDYEFLGIRDIAGQSKLGAEYMEFYPDENSVLQTVVELFYKPKE